MITKKTVWEDDFGQAIEAHLPRKCAGQTCVLHNPTSHKMLFWPAYFRIDRSFLVERMCSHGVGHPDPDSARFLIESGRDITAGLHGCDGCCAGVDK